MNLSKGRIILLLSSCITAVGIILIVILLPYTTNQNITPSSISSSISNSGQNGTTKILSVKQPNFWSQISGAGEANWENQYTPPRGAVLRGTVVSWKNIDNVIHTITSNDGGKTFDSGPISPGAEFILDTSPLSGGYYGFHDKLNSSLVGDIRIIDPRSYNDISLIRSAENLTVSEMFLSKHPDASVKVEHNYYDSVIFDHQFQIPITRSRDDNGIRTLQLSLTFDRNQTSFTDVSLGCIGGPIGSETSSLSNVIRSIYVGWCTSYNSFSQQIHGSITIQGVNDSYTLNAPIKFSTVVNGYGTGCGDSIAIIIRDEDPQFKSQEWHLQPQCVANATLYNFTNIEAVEGIASINQAGNYSLIASYHDESGYLYMPAEKTFVVLEGNLMGNKKIPAVS